MTVSYQIKDVNKDRSYRKEWYGILDLKSIVTNMKNKTNSRGSMVALNWQKNQ